MKPRWTGASMLVAALGIALLPMAASAAPLPAPVPTAPSAAATVDQPVFSWSTVDGAAYYEVEVALDDQFVTVTDPGDEMPPRVVHGTTYVPTFSYTAKTHYWHVRAVAANDAKGTWSATREFTRRWTNDDEPAGTEGGLPSSRVENVRLVGGGSTPAINRVAVTWESVPGAAYYEVEFSARDGSQHVVCSTPHTTLTAPWDGSYDVRSPLSGCGVLSPLRSWVDSSAWTPGTGTVSLESADVDRGDLVYVRFLNKAGTTVEVNPFSAVVMSAGGDPRTFTVPTAQLPPDADAKAQYFKVSLPMEADQDYWARVRAVDTVVQADYPKAPVYGMWSNQRPEPQAPMGSWLHFTPTAAESGTGTLTDPAVPDDLLLEGTDVPLLSWEPAPGADAYAVTIALDRDFTNPVAHYATRGPLLVPPETFDDNGPNRSYYWHVEPCVYSDITETDVACLDDDIAINDPAFVGRFAKRSAAVSGLSATSADSARNVLLRWGDALTAAQALDSSYTPGGVDKYEVQYTSGEWSDATSKFTDNLAYNTSEDAPLKTGTYRWRVRPLDGQGVPLAWAYGTDFSIVQPDTPGPSPSQSTPGPIPSTSAPNPFPSTQEPTGPPPAYQPPPASDGIAGDIPPERPGKPGVKRSGRKYLRIHWRASEELGSPVTTYLVYRSTNGASFSVAERSTSTTVKLRASRKKTYWFYIVADSEAGRSEASATTKFPK